MSYSIAFNENQENETNGRQWDNLLKKVPPNLQFLNKDWYKAWEEKYLVQKEANSRVKYILLLDEKSNIDGMFPYAEFSKFGIKIISLAGLYYPFRSILFSSENSNDCAKALVENIHNSKTRNIIRIGPAYEDESTIAKIKQEFLGLGWSCYEIYRGDDLKIELPRTVSEFRDQLGKKFVKKLERRKRKFSELGDVEYIRYSGCSIDVWENVIDMCSQVEKRSWLAKDKEAELRILENREFWKSYLQSQDASQRVVVWIIKLNGKPVAFSFAIDAGKQRYSFSGHYDEDYRKYGLGIIIDSFMYEDAVESGIATLDMGTGEADYKARWGATPGSRVIDYIYLPPNLTGHSINFALRARNKIRSGLHSLYSK